jgi:hypothetical protein
MSRKSSLLGFFRGRGSSARQTETDLLRPDVPLIDVVYRMIGQKPGTPLKQRDAVADAFAGLRQLAASGRLEIFGCVNWRKTGPESSDESTKIKIQSEYWLDHRLDLVDFMGETNKEGCTCDLNGEYGDYRGIWFDQSQIDARWPAPRKKGIW